MTALGSPCKDEWLLDPTFTFLNHGSYGAVPRIVLSEQSRWRDRMEQRPTGFMTCELPQALREAAGRLSEFLQCRSQDLVFVENATVGCNTVFHCFELSPGDEIVVTDHCYPAVRNAVTHAASRSGARVVVASIPFPVDAATEIVNRVASYISRRTRLAVFDHVTSPTAIIFPVFELVALCRRANVPVLIDGAHAPGMLALDIPTIGADWYVGNCHKWLMAPKGSGFIWVAPERQSEMRPLVISHGYGRGFTSEFDWTGTRDPSAWLSVPAAIDFHARYGGGSLVERNASMAQAAAQTLAEFWGTDRGAPDSLTGSMAAVRLPIRGPAAARQAIALRTWLYDTHRIDVAITEFADSLWARISAQAYNEDCEYQRLAEVVRKRQVSK